MALPVLQKTYQAGSGPGLKDYVNFPIVAPASATDGVKRALLQIKQAMVGMNTNPWTVVGSSDAVAASMDGTDRWVDTTDLVENPGAGNYSWIVLRNTAIAANFEVCFAMVSTDPQELFIGVSPSAGFTGGAINNRPTATDEHEVNGEANFWCGNMSTSIDLLVSVVMSTDGEVTRIHVSNAENGSEKPMTIMGFEVPKSPLAGWTNPSIYYHYSELWNTGKRVTDRDEWDSTSAQTILATVPLLTSGSEQVLLTAAGPMANGNSAIDSFDEVNGIRFYSPQLIREGFTHESEQVFGTLFDWYYPSLGATNGAVYQDAFPASGERQFVCIGEIIQGWFDDAETDFNMDPAEFVSATTATKQSGTGSSFLINTPAGVQEGDLLVFVYFGHGGAESNPTDPGGWTVQSSTSGTMDGFGSRRVVYTKIATGAEPANYTFTKSSGTTDSLGAMLAYRPSHTAPLDGIGNTVISSNTNHPMTTAVVHNLAQSLSLSSWLANGSGAGLLSITTPPAVMTNRVDLDGSAIGRADLRIAIYDEPQPNDGAPPARSIVWDRNADGVMIHTAIRALGAA